tara:strand:- start:592 stop:711 length:120 start_codon:yes stop_codon:yes gene_type:complete
VAAFILGFSRETIVHCAAFSNLLTRIGKLFSCVAFAESR